MKAFSTAFLSLAFPMISPAQAAEALPSPVNQVFQFAHTAERPGGGGGSSGSASAYLWIPETCQKLRGLVIFCNNVPEHRLVGHPAIREACRANDLGLIWSVPTFWNFAKDSKDPERVAGHIALLQTLLDGLADKSGYSEISTIPWLPVGESGHLLMVCGIVNQKPERCIASICVKNPHHPENKSVPMLWTLGTAQEWGQTDHDPREHWKPSSFNYQKWVRDRAHANWPLSMLVEPGSGHFYCTDVMTDYFARYITAACRARLSDDGGPALKPVSLDHGVLADLPLPGHENAPVTPYADAAPAERSRPWFFDESTARGAQAFAAVDWNAQSAMPSITAVSNCTVAPFSFNSVTELVVTTDSEFAVKPILLEKIPAAFVGAGAPLAMPPVHPVAEWVCGPYAPLGGGRFRVALDRTWKTGAAAYMAVRQDAAPGVRFGVQPIAVKLVENNEGQTQKITFPPMPDVTLGSKPIDLTATSDARLPVQFFVVSGPALVQDGRLVFTTIPPRARFPVEVTVAAWQWGRSSAPKVRTAPIVRQTFRIHGP